MPERMRIALIAPIARPVRRDIPSSIEHLVWLLTEELVRRGHEVTLFASGDSETSASLHAVYPESYATDRDLWDEWYFHEVVNTAAAFERAGDFDLVHAHSYQWALPFNRLARIPTLVTHHINPSRGLLRCFRAYPETQPTAVSRYHRSKFVGIRDVPVVLNGIDLESFPFCERGGDYLLFLGHLIPRKGVVEAIEVARRAGIKLVLAGRAHGEYFEQRVAPLIDGRNVEHLGPVGIEERNRLLSGAGALLFTSEFAEPFGLVLVEAAACGTPTVALKRCAVAEIVQPGVTGYYEDKVERLVERVADAMALDRHRVRRAAAEHFGHEGMVDDYESLYRRVLRAHGHAAPTASGSTP